MEFLSRCALRWTLPGVLALSAAFAGRSASADPGEDIARANQLRAGYLLNFARFVEWPASAPPDALTVCFLGGAPLRDAFIAGAAGKQIGHRNIVTRTLNAHEFPDSCQLLYVEGEPPPASTGGIPPVLTVGDLQNFIHRGGIVELFTDDNHLRFKINLYTAKRAGLRISSNLLQLASQVEDDPK